MRLFFGSEQLCAECISTACAAIKTFGVIALRPMTIATSVSRGNNEYARADVLNEALNQAPIEGTGLHIPRLLEVTVVAGKWAIASEYIIGRSPAQLLDLHLEGMAKHTKVCRGDFTPLQHHRYRGWHHYILTWSHAPQGNADKREFPLLWGNVADYQQTPKETSIMKITICIGSSCHLKGSRQIVEELQKLVRENDLSDKIELAGQFCMGNCQNGVCVTIGDEAFSLTPDTTRAFFEKDVLPRL